MKSIIICISCLLSLVDCAAQDRYDTALIPASLRSRANAIIRHEETTVDMRAVDYVVYAVKQAITVINSNGENNAQLVLFYDKSTNIKSIKGEVYTATGKLFGNFTQRDFIDESAVHDFSLYEDTRLKRYLPTMSTYPYTVVYQYEVLIKQNLILPSWVPKPADDVAVEQSTYTFICKPTDKFRIKTQKLPHQAEESSNEKQKMLTWKVTNLPAIKTEPFSPNLETYQTFVKIAPENFSYYQHSASYTNWQELGKWIYNDLLKDRTALPAATQAAMKDLVKDEKTDIDKARKIYQYLQDKTRYISVQIGIGGFKPFSATNVDRLGYGDCKALVNYMQSLLKAVDIDSYYCIVKAGDEKKSLDPTFASMNQANHVILCIPLAGDTTWLECTSQKIPFGFLSNFTDDRLVLACTPTGGKLLRTPAYSAQQNMQKRSANFTLDKSGNIAGQVSTSFKGITYDDHLHIVDKPLSEKQKLLKQSYSVDHINFETISYVERKDILPELQENLTMTIRNYGAVNNNQIFLSLLPFHSKISMQEVRNRTLPVHINRGHTEVDSISYTLTEEFIPTLLPIEKVLQNQFGSYVLKTSLAGNVITHYRKLTLHEGNFAAADYIDLVKFINEVNTNDQLRVVLSLK